MKINNENEKYTIHFIFHTKYLRIKSSRLPVVRNDVNITYQVTGRQHITQNMIHDNNYIYIYIYIQVYSSIFDYLIE